MADYTNGYDTSFTKAAADQWVNDVQNELKAVKEILNEVEKECADKGPNGADLIITTIIDCGLTLGKAWLGVMGQFDVVIDAMTTISGSIGEAVGNMLNKAGEEFGNGQEI